MKRFNYFKKDTLERKILVIVATIEAERTLFSDSDLEAEGLEHIKSLLNAEDVEKEKEKTIKRLFRA